MPPPLRTRNAVVRGPDPRRFDEALRRYRPSNGRSHARRTAAAVEGLLRQAAGVSAGRAVTGPEGSRGSVGAGGGERRDRLSVRIVSRRGEEGNLEEELKKEEEEGLGGRGTAAMVLSVRMNTGAGDGGGGQLRRMSEHVAYVRVQLYDRATGALVCESRVRVDPGAVYVVARIRRPEGAQPVRAVVRLEPTLAGMSFVVSPALRAALEAEPMYGGAGPGRLPRAPDGEAMPLTELCMLLWLYIKGNKLQDRSDPSFFSPQGTLKSAVGGEHRLRFRDALGGLVRAGSIVPVAHVVRLPEGFEDVNGNVCEADLGEHPRNVAERFGRGIPSFPAPCPRAEDTVAEDLALTARRRAEELRIAACEGIANAPHRFLSEFLDTQKVLARRAAG